MEHFIQLAEYGAIGLAFAILITLIYIVRAFIKVITNHLSHSTNATIKNSEIMSALKTLIETKLK